MIYYDNFGTWRKHFGEVIVDIVGRDVVYDLAASSFEYIEDAGEHVARHTDIKTISTAIKAWLRAHDFCVFHGTRLLPEEVIALQQEGLRPLVATSREKRLRKILERHPSWISAKEKFYEAIEKIGPQGRQGRREGQVHFSLSRSGLVSGFNHYLTHGSEFDQHVVQFLFDDDSGLQLLKTDTIPFVVHTQLSGEEVIQGANPHFSYCDVVERGEIPGLARTFLNAWAFKVANPSYDIEKLRTDCCMVQHAAIPRDRIIKMENLGDSDIE